MSVPKKIAVSGGILVVLTVLAWVFGLYLQPDFLLQMGGMVWLCG